MERKMMDQKWVVYVELKRLSKKVWKISEGTEPPWRLFEEMCRECELTAENICELMETQSYEPQEEDG